MNPSSQSQLNRNRFQAPDALRGLIMILMALDHANHFVAQKHSSGEYWGGSFPEYNDPLSFLTRIITHLSAPGFFFLMGLGMWLFANSRKEKGWRNQKIIFHFFSRGAILIALQFLIVNPAWALSPTGWVLEKYIGVLFALGGAMILTSFMPLINTRFLTPTTLLLFFVNSLSSPNPIDWGQPLSVPQKFFTTPGGDLTLWSNYPILPWLPLVTLGIIFGYWLNADKEKAYKRSLGVGVLFIAAFLITRSLGNFWSIRPLAGASLIDFLNVVKYPPSLSFIFLTMGINLILLWALSNVKEKFAVVANILVTYGRVPLFFYITHLYLYAGLATWFTPTGSSIRAMYPYWILGLLILYPICIWYFRIKTKQPGNSPIKLF